MSVLRRHRSGSADLKETKGIALEDDRADAEREGLVGAGIR